MDKYRREFMELQLWREMLTPYELAVDELVLKFRHIIREYRNVGRYSPIEQVDGRVKSISSILDKMQRKKINVNDVEKELEDIDRVLEIIESRSDMEIKSHKDYISHSKDSGYRSYHVIIYYEVNTIYGKKRIQAEIQIRTLAMNFWATVEHSLQYKYKGDIPQHEMSTVRDEIMDAQDSFRKKSNLVSEILHTMQNLYKVANRHEVLKIQDEFYKIYETGDMERLEHFNKQLDIIAEGYRAQSIS